MKKVWTRVLVILGIFVCLTLGGTAADAAASVKMNPGQTKQLTAPKKYRSVKWSSSRKKIAKVNKKGKVTAVSEGTVVITAKSGNKTKRFKIIVKKKSGKTPGKNSETERKPESEKTPETEKVPGAGKMPETEKIPETEKNTEMLETEEAAEMKMNVKIGSYTFTATLEENDAVRELVEMMKKNPVVISMDDYSGFEKVGSLGRRLTTSNKQTTTKAGDIVLYNGNNIVMFYGSNSWSYTRIGKIDDLTNWKKALGSGSITVEFSIE